MKKNKSQDYDHKSIESKWPRKDFSTSSAVPSDSGNPRGKQDYDHKAIESKWQSVWEKERLNQPDLMHAKKPFYNLMMYPYPSAEGLHVGNMYAFTGADIYGRFKRMNGFDVFEPIGFDSGGIHSENFAIKMGIHPREMVEKNVATFTRQLKKIGAMYDWAHTVDAMDPNYYKWTQWIFVQLFKAGLAYKKEAPVIWCPSCKTTLSDEQTEKKQATSDKQQATSGKKEELEACNLELETITVCERCKTPIERRNMEQWFFKITDYAERLLKNTEKLNWTEKVLTAQRNWIGKSEGVLIKFKIQNEKLKIAIENSKLSEIKDYIKVFTTRPDTLHGCTFLCVAPEHEIVAMLLKLKAPRQRTGRQSSKLKAEIENYIKLARNKADLERRVEDKEKTGVFTGLYVINPVNGEKIPVYVADYVLMDYGGGAVMGVPGHDRRDWDFAKKYNLPIKVVVVESMTSSKRQVASRKDFKTCNSQLETCSLDEVYDGSGVLVNSGPWDGWRYPEDMDKVIKWLEDKDCGKKVTTYKLRDWCISRQRYWGPPIPMVFCEKCAERGRSYFSTKSEGRMEKFSTGSNNSDDNMAGWYPVPEEDLPVLLPNIDDYLPASSAGRPDGSGKAPLARHPEFYKTRCPKCGGEARRETDVSDTFLDSSWYCLRYPSARIKNSKCKMKNYNSKLKKTEIKEVSAPWDEEITKRWLPVDQYTGGAEHSVLHLMYSRFITMALHDMGYLDFSEPFPNFYAHGLIIKDGAKMSKSKGNVVNPDEYIEKYGTDALRSYLMFIGPFNQGGDFRDTGMRGMYRFVKRIHRLAMKSMEQRATLKDGQANSKEQREVEDLLNRASYRIGKDISRFKYNTAIAKLMEFVTFWDKNIDKTGSKIAGRVAIVIAPLMPHLAEEIWQVASNQPSSRAQAEGLPVARKKRLQACLPADKTGNWKLETGNWSVHQQSWPEIDEGNLRKEIEIVIVQVNGKLREKLKVASDKLQDKDLVVKEARDSEKVKRYLIGKTIKKTIFVPGKLVNFVV